MSLAQSVLTESNVTYLKTILPNVFKDTDITVDEEYFYFHAHGMSIEPFDADIMVNTIAGKRKEATVKYRVLMAVTVPQTREEPEELSILPLTIENSLEDALIAVLSHVIMFEVTNRADHRKAVLEREADDAFDGVFA